MDLWTPQYCYLRYSQCTWNICLGRIPCLRKVKHGQGESCGEAARSNGPSGRCIPETVSAFMQNRLCTLTRIELRSLTWYAKNTSDTLLDIHFSSSDSELSGNIKPHKRCVAENESDKPLFVELSSSVTKSSRDFYGCHPNFHGAVGALECQTVATSKLGGLRWQRHARLPLFHNFRPRLKINTYWNWRDEEKEQALRGFEY